MTDFENNSLDSLNLPLFGEENYCCVIRGTLKQSGNDYKLVTADEYIYNLKKAPPELVFERSNWLVTPSINSNGMITKIILEDLLEETALDEIGHLWIKSGRVVQISQAKSVVLLKIARPQPLKPIKISLRNPSPEMRTGHLWSVSAFLKDRYFVISSATRLDPPDGELVEVEPIFDRSKIETIASDLDLNSEVDRNSIESNNMSITSEMSEVTTQKNSSLSREEIAEYLATETEIKKWQISKPIIRNEWHEWNCYSSKDGLNARVIINSETQNKKIFTFPTIPLYSYSDAAQPYNENFQDNNLEIKILSAGQEIAGSCNLIKIENYSILLDCGLNLNSSENLLENITQVDLILITHAHLETIAALPELYSRFPDVKIISNAATRELARPDLLEIEGRTTEELEEIFWRWQTLDEDIDFYPLPRLKVRFINAGHLCGAVSIYLATEKENLFFTSDFNIINTRITNGLKLDSLVEAKFVLLSGVLATKKVISRKKQESQLISKITKAISIGQNTIISGGSSFASLEIFFLLITSTRLFRNNIPIYLTERSLVLFKILVNNLNFLPESLTNFLTEATQAKIFQKIKVFTDFDSFQPLRTPYILLLSEKEVQFLLQQPELFAQFNNEKTHFILSSQDDNEKKCARALLSRHSPLFTKLLADYSEFDLYNHADRIGVGQILNKLNPQKLILINGYPKQLESISELSGIKDKAFIHIPNNGETISPKIINKIPQVVNLTTKSDRSQSSVRQLPPNRKLPQLIPLPEVDSETSTNTDLNPTITETNNIETTEILTSLADQEVVETNQTKDTQLIPTDNTVTEENSVLSSISPEIVSPQEQKEEEAKENLPSITVDLEPINPQVYILSLPDRIALDPRWKKLLQNNKIQVRFSGSDLVFLNSNRDEFQAISSEQNSESIASCQTCQFFIDSQCQQDSSPLYGLSVDPHGICSQYTNSNNEQIN